MDRLKAEGLKEDAEERSANSWSAWLRGSSESDENKASRARRRAERATGFRVHETRRHLLQSKFDEVAKEMEQIQRLMVVTQGQLKHATEMFHRQAA